jgi:hypothetical protein
MYADVLMQRVDEDRAEIAVVGIERNDGRVIAEKLQAYRRPALRLRWLCLRSAL